MNRSGYTRIAAYALFSALILFTTVATRPPYFEYLMIFFALPVMLSSFVLQPTCSFLFASLTVSSYAIVSALAGYLWNYNLTAAFSLFGVAAASWIISSQLEDTIGKNETLYRELQASNQKLFEAYEATIEGWPHALELRDKETEGHTRRASLLSPTCTMRSPPTAPTVKRGQEKRRWNTSAGLQARTSTRASWNFLSKRLPGDNGRTHFRFHIVK